MPYNVDPDLCTGCGSCIAVCPAEAITFDGECARIDEALCAECGELRRGVPDRRDHGVGLSRPWRRNVERQ